MRSSKITRIVAENYKAFAGRVEVDVAPLTLIFGNNGSGKSALVRLPAAIAGGLTGTGGPGLPLQLPGDLLLGRSLASFVHGGDADEFSIGFSLADGMDPTTQVSLDLSVRRDPRSPLRLPAQWIDRWRLRRGEEVVGALRWDKDCYRTEAGEEPPPSNFDGLLPVLPDGTPHPWTRLLRPAPWVIHLGAARGVPGGEFTPFEPMRALDVGLHGDATRQVLGALLFEGRSREILDAVIEAVRSCFGVEMRVVEMGEGATIGTKIECRREQRSVWLPLGEMGTGLLHALPLIVHAAIAARPGEDLPLPALVTCEEPEAHSHPAVQARLADVVIDAALAGTPMMIETHSETFVLRVRRRVAEGRLPAKMVALYWVNDEGTTTDVRRLGVDERGQVEEWPEGWFDTALHETTALHRAMRWPA